MSCECREIISMIADWATVFIALFALVFSIKSLVAQRKHDKNSVRPILDIVTGDYENCIYVNIENNGIGPAIIKNTCCKYKPENGTCFENEVLYVLLNDERIKGEKVNRYDDYIESIRERTIAPGGRVSLIEVSGELLEDDVKESLRKILKDVTIIVDYENVYNDKFRKEKKLTFFGRHFV